MALSPSQIPTITQSTSLIWKLWQEHMIRENVYVDPETKLRLKLEILSKRLRKYNSISYNQNLLWKSATKHRQHKRKVTKLQIDIDKTKAKFFLLTGKRYGEDYTYPQYHTE